MDQYCFRSERVKLGLGVQNLQVDLIELGLEQFQLKPAKVPHSDKGFSKYLGRCVCQKGHPERGGRRLNTFPGKTEQSRYFRQNLHRGTDAPSPGKHDSSSVGDNPVCASALVL